MRKKWLVGLALVPLTFLAAAQESAPQPERLGVGWSLVHLDKVVDIDPESERITVSGRVTVRLESLDSSYGPTLNLNYGSPLLTWDRLDAGNGATTQLNETNPLFESARLAHVRFENPKRRGDEITLEFEFHSVENGAQLGVRHDFAMASWVEAWTPVPIPRIDQGERFRVGMLIAPGTTTLRMPENWVGLTDGALKSRTKEAGRTVEVWDVTGVHAARSFVAGPFTIAEREADGRAALVYRLTESGMSADALAVRMAEVIAALESKLGPFPAPSYGIVEAPDDLTDQWYAASQQTFIVAKSSAFGYDHGNTPLWAHESCHAWWGNLVGSEGIGSKMCSEALAQLGVLIALEETEGRDAMNRFLDFSRSGYSSVQCAAGYFHIWREGGDKPLSQIDDDRWDHNLSDSKGVWFWHMLRQRLGDDVFFGVLRAVIQDRAGELITLDAFRQRFIDAAPNANLESFFAQWLDRAGAPILDLDWWAARTSRGERAAHVELRQRTDDLYALDLEIEIELETGERIRHRAPVHDATTVIEIPTGDVRPVNVVLDPDRKTLLWRPIYGARPGDAGADESLEQPLSEGIRIAIIGAYAFGETGPAARVVELKGQIILQVDGREDLPLRHVDDGVFSSAVPAREAMVIFDLSTSPSPGFELKTGDATYSAQRKEER